MVGEYGISSSEYWSMTPSEVGIIMESKRPKTVGKLSESDYEDLEKRREELTQQGVNVI